MALKDKVFLITGGTQGIGRAIAQRVARDGAKVVISYSRDSSAADSVVAQLGGPDKALAVKADAGKLSDIDALVQATVDRFGRIDVLVPNAGILSHSPLAGITEETFDLAYTLNVKGPLFLAQKAVPHIPQGGKIIFISSGTVKGSTVPNTYILYTSTKGAIEQIVRVMSKELAATKGITVNAVAPGPTATEFFFKGKPDAVVKAISAQSPFARLGTPEEAAAVVALVASPEASWISGQTIGVNGAAFV
ncbi:hypothetical protein GGR57DRAFT_490748 [Xylariaceae sp. FL1272]|nr:hypothetical protein GGR57DRAFT_490748 [Xylariaceae sp. FL1272]